MTSPDQRGFAYALEPALQQAQHRFDAALGRLGQSQRLLEERQSVADALTRQYRESATRLVPEARAVIDPVRALASARHLQRMRQQLARAQVQVDEQRDLVHDATGELDGCRMAREMFEGHRRSAAFEHGQELVRAQQTAADHNWLARMHWRNAQVKNGRIGPLEGEASP